MKILWKIEQFSMNVSNWLIFLGGPVVIEEDSAVVGSVRFILVGTVHGAFSGSECSSDLPGIFVETDNLSVLKFLYKEAYGSGLLNYE